MEEKKLQSFLKRAKEGSFYHFKIKKDYLNKTQETITKTGKTEKSGYIKNKTIFFIMVHH